jgi:hypothetical protein
MTEINKFSLPTSDFIAMQMQSRLSEGKDIKLELLLAQTLARTSNPQIENKILEVLKNESKSTFEKAAELLELSKIEPLKPKFLTH